jgi:hypothetical protein
MCPVIDAAFLARARQFAVDVMPDACTIARPGTLTGAVNPATGLQSASSDTQIYSGPCYLSSNRVSNPRPSNVASDFPIAEAFTLRLPSKSGDIRVQDVVVLTAAPDHPQDVGRRMKINSVDIASHIKQQRFQVEVITG